MSASWKRGRRSAPHILSGNVIDPRALNELIPDWQEKGAPLNTPVTDDRFYVLSEKGGIRVPNFLLPPLMHNDGNYAISLGNLCRWLAGQAEALGVEIYPGFCRRRGAVPCGWQRQGVSPTGDMGIGKDGAADP